MIISVNWLREFTQIDGTITELADIIGSRLVEIEGVESLSEKYDGVVIARVIHARKLENSDHLNVALIDDGRVVKGVERDRDGYVQVVCGAPNVREDMLVAWLPPGTIIPETYGTAKPLELGARKFRGELSNGMLASARELDLYDDHSGIVEIDKDVALGTPFSEAYALDDYLLDIENKSLTHRPDTFGVIGFAREVSAIAGKGFSTPDWLMALAPDYGLGSGDQYDLHVSIENPGLSQRYQAAVLAGVEDNARTPLQIQTYLSRSGVRPISPIVDVTNYMMLLTGQPLHAFDYDKVVALAGSADIHVRAGRAGEMLDLLDGRRITLTTEDIVVAAGEVPVALAGAMGGTQTQIDETTKTIILESATFNLYNLRATQMRHGIFSEAITRFTKGTPPALTAPVLAQAIKLISKLTGAQRVSHVADAYPEPVKPPTLSVSVDKINATLGTKFNASDIVETLRSVEFDADTSEEGAVVHVTPPYWRTDIHIDEDCIEEVGRINGFDTIELSLPTRDFTAISPTAFDTFRSLVRHTMAVAGANEVLTYSFVHGDTIKKAGQNPGAAYQLSNALSPQLQYYRLTLTPSLLDKVNMNLRQKFDEFALFELNKTHQKDTPDETEPNLPYETHALALTFAANTKRAQGRGTAFYEAKYIFDFLCRRLNVSAEYRTFETSLASSPFEPKRSASVYIANNYIGTVGEYRGQVRNSFKLPDYSAGFEINLDALFRVYQPIAYYTALSRFPGTEQDVCFKVAASTPYESIILAAREVLQMSGEQWDISPVDIYQPESGDTKNVTIRLSLTSHTKTLTTQEANDVVAKVIDHVTRNVDATVV